jgi:chromosome segregation ATPase
MKSSFAVIAAASVLTPLSMTLPALCADENPAGDRIALIADDVTIHRDGDGKPQNLETKGDVKYYWIAKNDPEKEKAQAQAAEKLADLKAAVRKQTGLVDVTPEAVRRLISTLQEQREQLSLDDAGAEGRRNALREAVANLSVQLDQKVQANEVTKAMQAVLDVRRSQLERIKALIKTGAAAQAEADQAEANVAAAVADQASARQKILGTAAAETLDVWNRELMEVTISREERHARLKYIETRLTALSEALGNLDQIEKLRGGLEESRTNDPMGREVLFTDPRFANWIGNGNRYILVAPATQPKADSEK